MVKAFLCSSPPFFFTPAFGQEAEKGVQVQPASPGIIETQPRNSITSVFRVTNTSPRTYEFIAEVDLPEGWQLVTGESPFELEPGEVSIRLVNFFVPLNALAGEYQISYTARAKQDVSIRGRDTVKVKVLLKAKLDIQKLEEPRITIAGEKYQSRFLVINRSNASSSVDLEIESGEGYTFSTDVKELRLDAGESSPVTITVDTDSNLRTSLKHRLRLTATAVDLEKGTVQATAQSLVDLVPRISSQGDYYHRLPVGIKFTGFSSSVSGTNAQIGISGSGSIDDKGIHKIDFLFRGPSYDQLMVFGLQREEYRLSFNTNMGGVRLGDHFYFLSKLTEFGQYGRGLEGEFNLKYFTLRGYYQESRWIVPEQEQKALQLSYRVGEKKTLHLNYLEKKEPLHPEDQILSLLANISFHRGFNLNLEYALGKNNSGTGSKTGSAFWVEAFGDYMKTVYRLNIIRAGTDYPGNYRDLAFNSAIVSSSLLRNFRLRASYHDQRRNLRLDPAFSATLDRDILLGLNYRFIKKINLFVEYRNRERMDPLPSPSFNYRDETIRFGASPNFGPLGLYASVDTGRTHNRLTRQSRKLVEYQGSISYRPISKLLFGGHIQFRDQDLNFTGDRLRRITLSFDGRLDLGRTSLFAYYRTAYRKEFYERILFDQSLVYDLMYNDLNQLNIRLTHEFANGHSIALRVRRNSFGFARGGVNTIGLVEYSIPFGVPVSRKSTVGELKGKVYDIENDGQGVPGVIIRANEFTTVTNKKGQFVFRSIKPGNYYLREDRETIGSNRITVEKTPINITVEGREKKDVSIGVVRSASMSGRIMVYRFEGGESMQYIRPSDDKKKRKLIEGYVLRNTFVELKSEEETYSQLTDEEGRFNFNELRPGKWILKVYDNTLPRLHYIYKDTFNLEMLPGSIERVLIRVHPKVRKIQIIKDDIQGSNLYS
jgi:hypothetical protein